MARPYNRRAVSTVNRAYSRDPLERIESIGGVNADRTRWLFSQSVAIARIEAGTDEFYITTDATSVKLVVRSHRGEKYLQSEREQTHPDDLLHLTQVGRTQAPAGKVSTKVAPPSGVSS